MAVAEILGFLGSGITPWGVGVKIAGRGTTVEPEKEDLRSMEGDQGNLQFFLCQGPKHFSSSSVSASTVKGPHVVPGSRFWESGL